MTPKNGRRTMKQLGFVFKPSLNKYRHFKIYSQQHRRQLGNGYKTQII